MSLHRKKDLKSSGYSDSIIDTINIMILAIMTLITIYPVYFILIASFSDPNDVNMGRIWLFPSAKIFTEGYTRVFQDSMVMRGYLNSAIITVVGTIVNLLVTLTGAYALSRKDFKFRKLIMLMVTFTMFFNGGMIPRFLVVKQLGLLNTIWALILPKAVVTWNLMITISYFKMSIPDELLEAARIDGCTNFKFFRMVVIPLSTTIMAILGLLYGVSHWNAYFSALLYIFDMKKYPIQLVLRNILIQNEIQASMGNMGEEGAAEMYKIAQMIKYSIIVFACLPIMIVFPFIQRYFVKGLMIGAIKG